MTGRKAQGRRKTAAMSDPSRRTDLKDERATAMQLFALIKYFQSTISAKAQIEAMPTCNRH